MDHALNHSEEEHTPDRTDTSFDLAGPDLTNVPLEIDFSLLHTKMTVGEVSTISPGIILDIVLDLDKPIDVSIGGAIVGKGRLIKVGDKVGVQIIKWSASSFSSNE